MKNFLREWFFVAGLATASIAYADISIEIHAVNADGVSDSLGTITATDNQYGLLLTPSLKGLIPGVHGFHVHQNPDCGSGERDGKKVAGLAAGGHYDPDNTGAHKGPYDDSGHLGDLPPLYVQADGTASTPILAPRLKTDDIMGRSLMIHMHGDNFSDQPKSLGGGGPRAACGVVK